MPASRSLCTHTTDCSVRTLWRTVQTALDQVLGKTTLQDLLRSEDEMSGWVSTASLIKPHSAPPPVTQ